MTALTERFGARDRAAVRAYERDCVRQGVEPTDKGRLEWVREWRQLDEDDRAAAAEVQQRENQRYFGWDGP